jgi:hypothetical protein
VKHRIRAQVTQPIAEVDGTVLIQPGTLLDPDDPRIAGLPPQHHKMVVESVEDDADWPEPAGDLQSEAKKAKDTHKADEPKKTDEQAKAGDMPPRPAQARTGR